MRYNISLGNNNTINFNNKINIEIFNPGKEIIENSTYIVNIQNNSIVYITSNRSNNLWKLIYADVPGIYKIVINSYEKVVLYENKSEYFRSDNSLPFF